jgi:hypothetical protein
MAQAEVYDRSYSFGDFATTNPAAQLPGSQVDAELDAVSVSVGQLADNLALIQRDDGALRNGVVTRDSLDAAVSLGFKPPVPWTSLTSYGEFSTIFYDQVFYVSTGEHTSGTDFGADLLDGRWVAVTDVGVVSDEANAARDAAQGYAADAATSASEAADSAATAAALLASREPTIAAGTTAQYWRGDKTWRDFATDVRAVGTVDGTITDAKVADGSKLKNRLLGTVFVTDHGAVGTGLTDDRAAVAAAAAAAGEDGDVHYPKGTYLLSSRINLAQARGVGPGILTDGVTSWPADRTRRRRVSLATRGADSVVVASGGYCHLPSAAMADDGTIIVPFYAGRNHGQSDEEGVSTLKPAGSVSLAIDGNEASGGAVNMGGQGSRIQIVCEGDETARTFTVSGIVGGVATTEVITGANAGNATGTKRFTSVSGPVVPSSATAGRVSVGLFTVPSDLKVAISEDGAQSWSVLTLIDGTSGWTSRSYEVVAMKSVTGRIIILVQYWDMVGAVEYRRIISDDNGRTWSSPSTPTFSGFAWSGTPYLYGNPDVGHDGGIRIAAYDSAGAFVLTTFDEGKTWTRSAVIAHPGGGQTYTEPGFKMLDDQVWLMLIRHNGTTSSFKQFVSTDGGASWTAQGNTNLVVTGAYVSPELHKFVGADGRLRVLAVAGARDTTSTKPALPGTIFAMSALVDDVVTSALVWTREVQVASFRPASWGLTTAYVRDQYVYNPNNGGTYRCKVAHTSSATDEPGVGVNTLTYWEYLPTRGGYPSLVMGEEGTIGGLVYADETAGRTSRIMFKRLWLNRYTSQVSGVENAWTPKIVGDAVAGANAYFGTTAATWSRQGNRVKARGTVAVNGALASSGNLSIAPVVAGSLPKPKYTGEMGRIQMSVKVSGVVATYMYSTADSENFALYHESTTAFSFVTDAEAGSGLTIRFEIEYETAEP